MVKPDPKRSGPYNKDAAVNNVIINNISFK